jgi:hypothetical protein
MNPHRDWFSEYEKYDGGDVFLGDDSTTKILGHGRVKLLLKYGRIRTLHGVLHIPKLVRSLISVSKLDDAGVDTIFEKGHLQYGTRGNGVDKGSSVWNSLQVVGKHLY